ncbi:hypothetical protein ACVWWO_001931 [Bradyrhizobium sp. F1.13.1]
MLLRVPEANSFAAAVWGDKFDTDYLKCSANNVHRCTPRLTCAGLKLVNSNRADASIRQAAVGSSRQDLWQLDTVQQ